MWFIYTCICCYECNAIFLLFYALGCCFISVHKNNSYVIVWSYVKFEYKLN